jgi:hypothetical protein
VTNDSWSADCDQHNPKAEHTAACRDAIFKAVLEKARILALFPASAVETLDWLKVSDY